MIISTLLGAAAISTVKTLVSDIFQEDNQELLDTVYDAIDYASEKYFDRYGDQFGTPSDSFLSRQENWDVVLRSMFYGQDELKIEDFNLEGYNDAPTPTTKSLEYLIESLLNVMRKNWELDKILSEKKGLRQIDEIKSIVGGLAGKKGNNEILVQAFIDKEAKRPIQNKLYELNLENGARLTYMVKKDTACVEYIFPDGASAYYEVDIEGNVNKYKSPYPLDQYSVVLDHSLIISKSEITQKDGDVRSILELKWGKRIDMITDSKNKLKYFHVEGGCQINHIDRKFIIYPPKEA